VCPDEPRSTRGTFLRTIDQKQPRMKKVASPARVRADENRRIVTLAKLEASITAPHKPPRKRGKLAGPHFARTFSRWHTGRVNGLHLASD
jgi:hypothetical protein